MPPHLLTTRPGARATAIARRAAAAILTLGAVRVASPQAPVRVCAGGDVALGNTLDAQGRSASPLIRRLDPARIVAPLVPLFEGADIALINVEGAIGESEARVKCAAKAALCYAIRQPSAAAPAIRAIAPRAVVVGNVANNHILDAGAEGRDETERLLGEAGVAVTGADTLPTLVAVGGDTVAVLGFGFGAGMPSVLDLDAVRRHVSRAAMGGRRVIVTMHMGAEGEPARHLRDEEEMLAKERRGNPVAFARAATEAGATLVIGHGPHVMRAIEWTGGTLVAYSLGNLLTYGPFKLKEHNGRAAVLCVTMGALGRVTDAQLKATRQPWSGRVVADARHEAVRDVDELTRADLPRTGAVVGRDGRLSPHP